VAEYLAGELAEQVDVVESSTMMNGSVCQGMPTDASFHRLDVQVAPPSVDRP
jgi:hypothetical protein